jgi:hypothetical protein
LKKDRRHRGWFQRIFSNDPTISWSRIVSTIVMSNVMLVWTASCIFGEGFQIHFTLEDMPQGLVLVLLTMFGGRVAQAYFENRNNKPEKPDKYERPD